MSNVNTMNKTELRAACKKAKISYGDMTVAQMRAALDAVSTPVVIAEPVVTTAPAVEAAPADAPAAPVAAEPKKPAAPKAPADQRNGVTRPRAGTTCALIWQTCETMIAAGEEITFTGLKEKLPDVNDATLRTQRQRQKTYSA